MGDRIRMAREAKGWDQDDLAEALGVEPPTISRWETGVHKPRAKMIPQLARALGRTPDWLQETDVEQRFSEIDARVRAMEALKAHIGDTSSNVQSALPEALSAEERELLRIYRDAIVLGIGSDVRRAVLSMVKATRSKKVKRSARG